MITYKIYNDNLDEWDDFIDISINGTVFQKQKFLQYHINRKFINHSLMFYKKKMLIAVFSASAAGNTLFSHPGASFGGIVYLKTSLSDLMEILDLIENYARKNNFNNITIIPTPFTYNNGDESLLYALKWKGFEEKEQYYSSIIPIKNNIHQQLEDIIRNKSRSKKYYNNIINENNLELVWVNNFDMFYPILENNKKKYGAKPTHSLDELNKIHDLMPDMIKLLVVKKDDVEIGGNMIFIVKPNIGIIFYNMINYEFSDMQISTIQMLESIRWAKDHSIQFLDFGVSHEAETQHPLTPKMSRIKFKEEFGGIGSLRLVLNKLLK